MVSEAQEFPVRAGDVVAGKYRIERVLGVGGMGCVFAAMHLHLDQRVALKFVRPLAVASAQSVERFLREARAAARLKSEHVAKVYDVGKLDSGTPYLVMEYLEGADLGRVLEDHGRLPVESAVDYVLQACDAVAEAHSMGIVHRDIKPQNLFLTRRLGGAPMVKVLDFGISKFSTVTGSRLTQTSSVMGSPLYMAPEQMRSAHNVDPRADIWALGVVLYELLTACVPFDAESMPELCLKVVHDPPLPPEALRPDLPAGLRAILARCLEKDPARRFAHGGELAAALEPFAPAASRPDARRMRDREPSSPHPTPSPPSPRASFPIPGALDPRSPSAMQDAAVRTGTPMTLQQTPASWGNQTPVPPALAPVPAGLGGRSAKVAALVGLSLVLLLGVSGGIVALRALRERGAAPASVTLTSGASSAAPVAAALPPADDVPPPPVVAPVLSPLVGPGPRGAPAGPPGASPPSSRQPGAPRVITSPSRARPAATAPATEDEIPALR